MLIDFGGGTIDVTIARISKDRIIKVSQSHDCITGGQDIDNKLA